MTTCYYKTNAPAVLTAFRQGHADRLALQAQIDAFAARFSAKSGALREPGIFAGLRFGARPPSVHWRAPDFNGLQWLRNSPSKGATPEQRIDHAALLSEWRAHMPTHRVDDSPLYRALGYTSSLDFALSGLAMFVRGDWFYAATSKPMPAMAEILGSEYAAALAAKP